MQLQYKDVQALKKNTKAPWASQRSSIEYDQWAILFVRETEHLCHNVLTIGTGLNHWVKCYKLFWFVNKSLIDSKDKSDIAIFSHECTKGKLGRMSRFSVNNNWNADILWCFCIILDFWTLHCSWMEKSVETVLKISLCSEEEIPTAAVAKPHKA